MDFTRIKIVKDDIDKFVNIPINMQWDFMGRDDSIQVYEAEAVREVIGSPQDFEIIRFAHNIFPNIDSEINYVFNFYDYSQPITANTIGNWTVNYLNNGFSVTDVYFFSKSFTNSFFKLDLYDTDDDATQQLFISIILPVQQGLTQPALLSPILPPVEIKIPNMVLDSIGNDKEGYYIYWLRKRNIIEDSFSVKENPCVYSFVSTLLKVIVIIHLIACGWYYIAISHATYDPGPITWVSYYYYYY